MFGRIAVLGGGLSGLSAAWFLKRAGHDVTLFEASNRAGGWIKTQEHEGFLFEEGPHSFRGGSGQEATFDLLEGLNLENQIAFPSSKASRRYIYSKGTLHSLPSHLWQLPFNPLTRGWLKALFRDWAQQPQIREEESISAFFLRHLGQSWVDLLVDPFVSGIFAGNGEELSLKSCFPMLYKWDQEKGSLLKAAWTMRKKSSPLRPLASLMAKESCFSFKKGMGTLPRAIAAELADRLHFNKEVVSLHTTNQGLKIGFKSGLEKEFDWVISTLPTSSLSSLLPSFSRFGELSFSHVVIVNLGYSALRLKKQGFGYLVPSQEKSPLLGVIWDSSLFPCQNKDQAETRLAVMMGGVRHPDLNRQSDSSLLSLALKGLKEQMGIDVLPTAQLITRANAAIPQYRIGYEKWKEAVKNEAKRLFPRLYLAGSCFAGVSLHECIAEGKKVSHLFFELRQR